MESPMFAYMRLVVPPSKAVIYVCFGDPPKDLPAAMIRALQLIVPWASHNDKQSAYFEVNHAVLSDLLNNDSFRWGIGGDSYTFYKTPIYEVMPTLLESAAIPKQEAAIIAIRDIARSECL